MSEKCPLVASVLARASIKLGSGALQERVNSHATEDATFVPCWRPCLRGLVSSSAQGHCRRESTRTPRRMLLFTSQPWIEGKGLRGADFDTIELRVSWLRSTMRHPHAAWRFAHWLMSVLRRVARCRLVARANSATTLQSSAHLANAFPFRSI